ncbi:hypothetical protein J3A83DRAFT_4205170 [Scleroderma citrinum]
MNGAWYLRFWTVLNPITILLGPHGRRCCGNIVNSYEHLALLNICLVATAVLLYAW